MEKRWTVFFKHNGELTHAIVRAVSREDAKQVIADSLQGAIVGATIPLKR